jgi:hypothetical protein
MTATMVLHRGARRVDREELDKVPTPEPTATWFPVSHKAVLDTSLERLQEAGYRIRKMELALNRANTQFFGAIDLDTSLVEGVTLAVGIRNSTDKSFPMGWAAGNRCLVSDNLALRSELLVKRKHTKQGEMRFGHAISTAVTSLRSFAEIEARRVELMQHEELAEDRAFALMLKAHLRAIVQNRHLHEIAKQWKEPAYKWGPKGSLWHLFSAMTYCLADVARRSPHEYAKRAVRLNQLCSPLSKVTRRCSPE